MFHQVDSDGPAGLVLASGSPRRRQLLSQLGIGLSVQVPQVDESPLPQESPSAYVLRVARAKAAAVAAEHSQKVVLAADTSVILADEIFGKPADQADAVRMLLKLSGRVHEVMTGVVAMRAARSFEIVVTTQVRFKDFDEAQAAWYVATGEPMDKAGAYAIQACGGALVASIAGSYSNVVGLPLAETLSLLEQAGLVLPWRK